MMEASAAPMETCGGVRGPEPPRSHDAGRRAGRWPDIGDEGRLALLPDDVAARLRAKYGRAAEILGSRGVVARRAAREHGLRANSVLDRGSEENSAGERSTKDQFTGHDRTWA